MMLGKKGKLISSYSQNYFSRLLRSGINSSFNALSSALWNVF